MSDRAVVFTIKGKDDFSPTFGKLEKDLDSLRRNLNLPLTGPLSKAQQQVEDTVVARIRAMEVAGNRARLASITQQAMVGNGPRARAANDIYRLDPVERENDFHLLAGYGSEVTRLRGGLSPRAGADAAAAAKGEANLLHVGAAAAAIAYVLDRAADSVEHFREDLRGGSSNAQSFARLLEEWVPGARGLRSLRDGLHNRIQQRSEEDQDLRDERERVTDRRDANRQAILIAAKSVHDAAVDTFRTAGVSGTARQFAQVDADYQKRLRELNEQFAQGKGQLAPDQLDAFTRQMNEGRAAALAERNDKIADLDRARAHQVQEDARQVTEWNRKSDEDVLQHRQAAQKSELELQGQFLKAKLDGVREAADQQTRELEHERDEEIRALEADPTIGKNASAVKDNARRRFEARRVAIRDAAAQEARAVRELDQREQDDAERDFRNRISGVGEDQQARRLILTGDERGGERLRLLSKAAADLEAIQKDRDEQLREHAERAPDIRRRAAELSDFVGADLSLSEAELQRRIGRQYAPLLGADVRGDAGRLTGTGSQTARFATAETASKAFKEQADIAKAQRDIAQRTLEAIQGLRSDLAGGAGKVVGVVPNPG